MLLGDRGVTVILQLLQFLQALRSSVDVFGIELHRIRAVSTNALGSKV